MGVVGSNGVLVVQLQCADKSSTELGKEMKRSSQKCHMSPDRLSTGKTTDSLVYHCLEDGRCQVFLGSAVIDQRLDVRLGKYTASCSNGVKCLIVLRIFVQTRCVCLKERSHLVDKRACASCTDAVHTLFNISAFKINNLGILTAKFDGYIGLRSIILQSSRDCNNLLDKRNTKILCKSQAAASSDDRRDLDRSQFIEGTAQQIR